VRGREGEVRLPVFGCVRARSGGGVRSFGGDGARGVRTSCRRPWRMACGEKGVRPGPQADLVGSGKERTLAAERGR